MCMELKVAKESLGSILNLLDLTFCVTSFLMHALNSLSLFCLSLSAAFGSWSKRVHFKSNQPTVESSLVIVGTEVSDEGRYICRVSTFPSGNFDREMTLTMWSESIHHDSAMLCRVETNQSHRKSVLSPGCQFTKI